MAQTSKALRMGIVGTGFGRMHLLGCWECPEVEVAAVCQRRREEAEAFAPECGIPHVFTDCRSLGAVGGRGALNTLAAGGVGLFRFGLKSSAPCEKTPRASRAGDSARSAPGFPGGIQEWPSGKAPHTLEAQSGLPFPKE